MTVIYNEESEFPDKFRYRFEYRKYWETIPLGIETIYARVSIVRLGNIVAWIAFSQI